MHSFKDLDLTDTENEQLQCTQHHKDIIKVCLQSGCDQLKLCQSCLSSHNSIHKEISIYQLFKEVQAKIKMDCRVEKQKDKFDIVFKNIQEMRYSQLKKIFYFFHSIPILSQLYIYFNFFVFHLIQNQTKYQNF